MQPHWYNPNRHTEVNPPNEEPDEHRNYQTLIDRPEHEWGYYVQLRSKHDYALEVCGERQYVQYVAHSYARKKARHIHMRMD